MSLPNFISDVSANRFKKTYFNGFVDVSGGDIIVRGGNVIVRENQQNDASNNHYITRFWAENNISGTDIIPLENIFTGALNTFTGNVLVNGNSTVEGNLILNQNSLFINSAVITLPTTSSTLIGNNTTNSLTNKTLIDCSANTPPVGTNNTQIATTSFVRNGTCKKVEVAPLEQGTGSGLHPLMMSLPNYASTNNESIVRIISDNLRYDIENGILTGLIETSKDITGDGTYTPSAGTIPYKISTTSTGFSAVGVSGELFVSQGSSRPIWTNALTSKTLTNCDANTQTAGNNSSKIATTSFVRNETCKKVEVSPVEQGVGQDFFR